MSDPVDLAFTRPGGRDGTIMEPTFSGAMSFMRRRYTKSLDGVDVAVVGIPFDLATTGRPGARYGPRAVRTGSAMIAWDAVWGWPFDPFEQLSVVDHGDIAVPYGSPRDIVEAIEASFHPVHQAGVATLMLGGDHFCSYPVLRSLHAHVGEPLALIHFDAHSDTWPGQPHEIDHGTMFWHAVKEGIVDPAHSIQLGLRTNNDDTLGMTVLTGDDVDVMPAEIIAEAVRKVVGGRPAYLTFDIDCLDPAFAPGTGTPVPGGLSTGKALRILRALGGLDIRSADVVEVAPAYDHADVTALAAATIALNCVALIAAREG
jgi:agmatinase